MSDEKKDIVTEQDVKQYAKLIAFIINNWKIIIPAVMFLSAFIGGAVSQYKHDKYNDTVIIPKLQRGFDSLLKSEIGWSDTLKIHSKDIKVLQGRTDTLFLFINDIYQWKQPYGHWGK